MRRQFYLNTILIIFLIVACSPDATPQTEEIDTAKTVIALTVQAVLPSETPIQLPSTAAPQSSSTPKSSPDPEISTDDVATFISDVTIPDYTNVEVNGSFKKTWRIQNTSDTTWTTEYNLVFESGEQMSAPDSIPLSHEVLPDGLIDITIEFVVPAAAGEYRSNWLLENVDGEIFGITEEALPIYVIVLAVDSGGGSSGSSGGIAGGATVTSASLSIDNPSYSGACPATLTLSGSVTTSDVGNALWSINLNASTTGFTFDPSGTYSLTFGDTGGTQFWLYTLFVSNSVNATATLNVTGANAFNSNSQNFSVTCQ